MFTEKIGTIKKNTISVIMVTLLGLLISGCAKPTQTVTINSVNFEVSGSYQFFTWKELPSDVLYEREPIKSFRNPKGETHYYEVIYVPSGNLNWFQAAYLAQDAGGSLVSITSKKENTFVFNLVNDEKYFWKFPKQNQIQTGKSGRPTMMNHHEIKIGPFIGGYQPPGSSEPSGGWSWLSGEKWRYTNWAVNLDDGVIDKDPRRNTQPNDSGGSRFGQRIMGFGEMNVPVPTWGDYMDDVGTYGKSRTPGRAYGFIIEYDKKPN